MVKGRRAAGVTFDFFRSDRLVCTEVIYRAFDGVGGISIPLRERAGRPTLSAEDLLDLAVDGGGFMPVAVAGLGDGGVATEEEALHLLVSSYRRKS